MTTDTLPPVADGFPDPLAQDGLFPGGTDPADDAAVPGAATGDPDAPYGFTADGKVRAKPGRKPGPSPKGAAQPRKATGGRATGGPKPPERKGPARKPPAAKDTTVDYRPAITKLITEGAGTLAIMGVVRKRTDLVADAAVVESNAPVLAELANQAADSLPVVAAILDKVLAVAPVAGGLGAVALMLGQIGVNHGLIPPGLIPGTMAPAQLMDGYLRTKMAESETFAATMNAIFNQQRPADAEATPAA